MFSSRWSGIFGLTFVSLQVIGLGLYLGAGTPPAPAETSKLIDFATKNHTSLLWASFLGLVAMASGILFFGGLRDLIAARGEEHRAAGGFMFGNALVSSGLALVGLALLTTATLDTPSRAHGDTDAVLFAAGFVMFVTSTIPGALAIASASYAVRRSGILPGWVTTIGWVAAALNAASVTTVFGGLDPAAFYSAVGPASTLMGVGSLMVWVASASIALLTAGRPVVQAARAGAIAR